MAQQVGHARPVPSPGLSGWSAAIRQRRPTGDKSDIRLVSGVQRLKDPAELGKGAALGVAPGCHQTHSGAQQLAMTRVILQRSAPRRSRKLTLPVPPGAIEYPSATRARAPEIDTAPGLRPSSV